MTRAACSIALLVGLLTGTAAFGDSLSPDRVRALVERGEILPLEEILKRNELNTGGRIIEIELERKRGAYVYEIKVLRPDGRYRELKIDARTGAIVESGVIGRHGMRILVVEDEKKLAADLGRALEGSGHVIEHADDGENAWFLGDTEDYDLVVLDLGLPKLDGLQVLKRWRANSRTMPILVLTARDSWSEKVDAIDAGADDYLTKPFRMEELLARVRALLRRQTKHASAVLTVGDITLDTRHARATKDGIPIDLSPLEYRLLDYLMHHAGRPVSQVELTEHVYSQDFERESNAIEVLVARLRRKLGSDAIKTRRGYGYYAGELDEDPA